MVVIFSSVQFSRSVVSDSLWPHESQHARPPCPSPTPRVHSDSRPLSPWCHPAISSSVVPFSSCPQSLPASESCPMSQLFAWGGQSTGISALTSWQYIMAIFLCPLPMGKKEVKIWTAVREKRFWRGVIKYRLFSLEPSPLSCFTAIHATYLQSKPRWKKCNRNSQKALRKSQPKRL